MNVYEFLFTSIIYSNGFLGTALILKKENPFLIASLSLFFGFSLFFLLFFATLSVFGKINILIMGGVLSILSCCFLFLYMHHSRNKRKDVLTFFASLAVFSGIYLLFAKYDVNLFCGDTFLLTVCAQKFSYHPADFAHNFKSLSSWGAVFVLIQHVGCELGLHYFSSLQGLLYISFSGVFLSLLFEALKLFNIPSKKSLFYAIFSTIALATSPIFLHVVFLLHTNSYLIYYFFLFFAFYWLGNIKNEKNYSYLSYLFLFVAAFSRVEAPIYCTITLFCILWGRESCSIEAGQEKRGDFKEKLNIFDPLLFKMTNFFCLVMGAWYAFLYGIGADSDILSSNRALFLMCIYFMIPIAFISLGSRRLETIKHYFFQWTYVFSFIAIIGTVLIFPSHILASLEGVIRNLLNRFWVGPIIFISGSILLILLNKRKRIPLEKSILTALFLMALSIISFSLFRQPFYASLYDSSNRIFVTLLPILFFYLTLKVSSLETAWSLKVSSKS